MYIYILLFYFIVGVYNPYTDFTNFLGVLIFFFWVANFFLNLFKKKKKIYTRKIDRNI